uniref:Uncharacterized protein n=1 Tax=Panagrolaimus sp. ES5 TaxID=591445 RepID=A0AC34FE50_9BILA
MTENNCQEKRNTKSDVLDDTMNESVKSQSFLPMVYNLNYLANVPAYNYVKDRDLADALAFVRSLKKGVSEKKCNEDATTLSVKTCAFLSAHTFPHISNNEIKDRRKRVMEEEIRMNVFAFIELCTDQAELPTETFKHRHCRT